MHIVTRNVRKNKPNIQIVKIQPYLKIAHYIQLIASMQELTNAVSTICHY
jgi:hypothetical protein